MSNIPNRASLSVAAHVRLCMCDGAIVVLDLRRGRYWSLSASASQALAEVVHGWPRGSASSVTHETRRVASLLDGGHGLDESGRIGMRAGDANAGLPSPARSLIDRLLSLGILTRSALPTVPDPALQEACESLDPLGEGLHSPANARRVSHFLWSSAAAAWALRVSSLHHIALRIAARRERLERVACMTCLTNAVAQDCSAADGQPLSQEMQSAALNFERLRPLAFSARDRCLHDSLSLVGYLAAEGLFARWVIGVKTAPFGAHSWVQAGRTVLNDQHEHVRAFRPILVV